MLEIRMLGYDWPRFHALLNDLPVALLVSAVFFDLAALATKRESFRQASFCTLLVGAVGGALAVISGLQAGEHIAHGEAVHRVMKSHETLGLISLGVFGVLAIWRLARERRMGVGERSFTTILGLAGVGVLIATGLYGGRLVFEHAAGVPSQVLEAELRERTAEHHHRGETTVAPITPSDSIAERTRPGAHVDPAGTPPHTHSDPPGTPPHTH
jgi:uncharacterized membrane protein